MERTNGEHCLPDAAILRFADGEQDDAERRATLRHLEECDACRARFRAATPNEFPEIDRYTIVERIGRGGFGAVYRAIHHEKRRSEALKLLYAKTPLHAAYFENEVHLIASLRHPNIATLYEAQLATPPLYCAMELVEGQRLDEYVRARRAPAAERIRIVRDVAHAIGHAHRSGVLHRDIKPQNIVMDAEGRPHIIDFGIGRRLGLAEADAENESTREGPIGTLGYIAPEQAARQHVDRRADVFALGVLLFHCVTGRPATQATRKDRLRMRLRRRVARSRDLAAIIARCTERDPQLRYPDCDALVADLDAYLDGRWVSARVGATGVIRAARIAGYMLRKRPSAVRAAVLVALIFGITGLFSTLRSRSLIGPPIEPHCAIAALDERALDAFSQAAVPLPPGVDVAEPKSLRLVHARVIERIASAAPTVIVLDYYFPDCQPDYDAALTEALRASPPPIIVGVDRFDDDGQARMCASLREAVDGFGALLAARPGTLPHELEVAVGVSRGFEPVIPGLGLAALAAVRAPQARVRFDVEGDVIHLRYQSTLRAFEPTPWLDYGDAAALHARRAAEAGESIAQPGDTMLLTRVPLPSPDAWTGRVHSYADILAASAEQLSDWFGRRAVLVGRTIPGADEYELANGQRVFGVQAQAHVLDALLSRVRVTSLPRGDLLARVTIYCLATAWIISRTPIGVRPRLRMRLAVCGVAFVAGMWIALESSRRPLRPAALESLIAAATACLAAGVLGAGRAIRAVTESVSPVDATAESSSMATTVRAARTASGSPPGDSSTNAAAT